MHSRELLELIMGLTIGTGKQYVNNINKRAGMKQINKTNIKTNMKYKGENKIFFTIESKPI